MLKLEDIAKLAGVSHSTVSRALAGSPLVNSATRDRIVALANDHGYQINQVARSLKLQNTKTIGLVVPELSNPYYPKLVQSIANYVGESGYSLQLHLSGNDQNHELTNLINLRNNRVDGILLITGEHGLVATDYAAGLHTSGMPIVFMGWFPGAEAFDVITGDDAAGARQIAHHLVDLQHKDIAIIGKPAHRGPYDRTTAFKNELAVLGRPFNDKNHFLVTDYQGVVMAVKQLVQMVPRPTAIFAYQDSIALDVCKELQALGIRVPDDISVIGFDDLDVASYVSPALTTVGCHIDAMAKAFVMRLTERIGAGSNHIEPIKLVVPTVLVQRQSSAPVRDA
jgi:LacI family transcriptional regulator